MNAGKKIGILNVSAVTLTDIFYELGQNRTSHTLYHTHPQN